MPKERGKIRGFYFEIDGADETLQEGLKNFGAALGRALSGPPRPMKALPPPGNKGKQADKNEEFEAEEVQAEPDALDAAAEENDPDRKKKNGAGRKASAMPRVIQLDLIGTKGVSLKAVADQKQPKKLVDRCLLATWWLKNHGGVAEVTPNHIFTCFKIMDWMPHPASYSSMLRDMKNKQKSLDKGATAGGYKINLQGENLVSKMEPES